MATFTVADLEDSRLAVGRCPRSVMPACRHSMRILEIVTCLDTDRLFSSSRQRVAGSCHNTHGVVRSVQTDHDLQRGSPDITTAKGFLTHHGHEGLFLGVVSAYVLHNYESR